jgi:alpha-L-arabinofuranosidase
LGSKPLRATSSLKPFQRRDFLRGTVALGSLAMTGQVAPLFAAEQSATVSLDGFNAEITVHTDSVLHRIDPKIYGSYTEHNGRTIYGGVYEEGSPLSNREGLRADVLKAAQAWGVTILRWPGGNFASGYHWMDGIGPRASRPRRYNASWFEEEGNHFGTDEYISFCREVGAEPYICVNLGTGTAEEAANWVEYCNGTGNTYYANLRRENGHQEPFKVKYWGLGNEVFGKYEIGHKDASDYVKSALEAAKLMKWLDPDIRLVAVGLPSDTEWNRVVLENLTPVVDYISIHDYEGDPDYYETLGSIRDMENFIRETEDAIDLIDPIRSKGDPALEWSIPNEKKRIEIAVDEWNIWYRKQDFQRRDVPNPLEEVYNLRDALWVASVLNVFHRRGKAVTLATYAGLVNVLGAMRTSETGLILQATYFPLKLYCRECGPNYLKTTVTSPTLSSKSFADIPYLDISATLDDARRVISLSVVNRHETQRAITAIQLKGMNVDHSIDILEIAGPSDAENTVSNPHAVGIAQRKSVIEGDTFTFHFAPHSITMLKFNKT